MATGPTSQIGSEQGPQSPAIDPNQAMAQDNGVAFEVYSINSQGYKKRHQVWRNKKDAIAHLAELKKLYGSSIQAAIQPIRDTKGNLFSQSVRKCMDLLSKGSYRSHTIGKTSSGKPIGSYATDPQHKGFSSAEHREAAALHASLHKKATLSSAPHEAAVHAGAMHRHSAMAEMSSAGRAHLFSLEDKHKGQGYKLHRTDSGHVVSFGGGQRYHIPHAKSPGGSGKLQMAKASPPVFGRRVGMVTGSGKIMSGKSPKISGHISTKLELGQTKSGKTIHNDPEHQGHKAFSAADHLDAYRAHARQLTHLDPKETHPSIIEHHKKAINEHYRMGVGGGSVKKSGDPMSKNFSSIVDDCRRLLKASKTGMPKAPKAPSAGAQIGKTSSGKAVMENGNKGHSAKGWTGQDHMDAFHVHHEKATDHRMAMMNHPHFQAVRNSDHNFHLTPEQTMARVSQHSSNPEAQAVMHHEKMGDHHHAVAEMHYQAAKKKK